MNLRRRPFFDDDEAAQWVAEEECDDNAHIIPLDDLYPHKLSKDCWCHPQEDDEHPELLVHQAADGRLDYEEGRRRPH
jgi:hypothetical protein